MRLTAELIHNSLSYLNPLHERELDLRGHKIPAIENLGVAKEQDAIDLTDNDISTLANFPLNPRLKSLYLARNRIGSVQRDLYRSIPNLSTLVLSENAVSELADLAPLAGFSKLVHLSLVDNPVASRENYRYYTIYLVPSVRFLDFARVRDAERTRAKELFGTRDEPTELAQSIAAQRSSKGYAPAALTNGAKGKGVKLTEEEKERLRAMIKSAGSLAEIARLETMLNEGRIPGM